MPTRIVQFRRSHQTTDSPKVSLSMCWQESTVLARAVKEQERREGHKEGFTPSPGDCLAYKYYRDVRASEMLAFSHFIYTVWQRYHLYARSDTIVYAKT